jgi:peptidoglycan hydrolase-like protein with peptidoglycan-binding domain
MIKIRAVAALLALGSLAALPACSSMMGGSSQSSSAPMAKQELSPAMVMQVQTTLQQQGMYHGNIDGLWGPVTQAAVQSYQQAHGLTANGQLDSPTLAALNAPMPATTASAAPPVAPEATPAMAPAAPSAPATTAPAAASTQ